MKTYRCVPTLAAAAALLAGCAGNVRTAARTKTAPQDNYRTTYEIFVSSFCDSDGDGIGDLQGVIDKLDEIGAGNAEHPGLGCDQLWLTPVVASPTYHKYDASDYLSVDPKLGTLEDYEALSDACHQRGMRLLFDLAVNHTSTEHDWFQAAAAYLKDHPEAAARCTEDEAANGNGGVVFSEEDLTACPTLDYYNFALKAQEGFAPLAGTDWYYEARFWEGMPDLNLDSEAVRREIQNIAQFWLAHGADGFRLDAVTSYYTHQNSRNIDFLTWLNQTVKAEKADAYLVGECWEDQSVYASYYASGVDSFFDFQFAGQDGIIANVVRGSKSAAAYGKALEKEEALYGGAFAGYVNAPFYTNHDMARSAGYYAKDNEACTKLAGALNLLMTGDAFVYYGEEIGMKGSGKDENKRAPMLWSSENPYAEGACKGPADMDVVKMKYPGVAEQRADETSIWQYFRQAIALRNTFPVIARGRTGVLTDISGDTICAFTRQMADDSFAPVLVVINTGKEAQEVSLAGTDYARAALAADLETGGEAASCAQGTLHLPARGIAVLQR